MSEPIDERDLARESASKRIRLTYDDYCRLPAGPRYELVEGELRLVPSPSVKHQEVSKRLAVALVEGAEMRNLGRVFAAPLDVVLNEYNVAQPDLLFITKAREGIITEANVQGAPDLVVEIISPSTAEWDRVIKRQLYERYGVRELWLVDVEAHTVEVAARRGEKLITVSVFAEGTMLTSSLLPGFSLELTELFASL